MKKLILLLVFGLSAARVLPQPPAIRPPMQEIIEGDLSFAARQYKVLMKNIPADRMPRTFDAQKNEVETSDCRWWCSGFYPGTLWYLYECLGDTLLKNEAVKRLALLESEKYDKSDHDLGFKMFCSFGNAYRITGEQAYKATVLAAAHSLSTRYRPSIRAIQSWDSSKNFKCPVIIDNMMNLELLEWAAANGGEKRLGEIAVDHANTTLENHFRPDYSSYHVVDYDLRTGHVLRKVTWQGAADSSAWSRGQAWALYGYTMMYRFTRDTAYLSLARHIARFLINNPHLPEDGIPYWDYDAPDIPHTYRDVSAAAVMASALLELGQYAGGDEKEQYRLVSEKILRSLSSDAYLAKPGTNGGFLLMHSVGALPFKVEVDVPLAYADYYFVEALLRYKKWCLSSQTEIEKVRISLSTSPFFRTMYTSSAKALPMQALMSRIDADGSFIRPDRNSTAADMTDSIYQIMYVFESPDSSRWCRQDTVKDKLYKALDYWLGHIPRFQWTSSAMEQPSKLGIIMIKLYDDLQADKNNPVYSSLIARVRQHCKAFMRLSWNNGANAVTFTQPSLGTIITDDWRRMGNVGYRLFGYTGIMAACNDDAGMDTLSTIVSNQFALQINKPNSRAIAALYDGFLHQHGPQTYNIGYGSDWLRALARFAGWTRSTRWALTPAQERAWGDILLNGMLWVAYKNHTPYNIMGRHDCLKGTTGSSVPTLFNEFLDAADRSIPQYASVLAFRNRLRGGSPMDSTKYLWNSDLILHHSPGYFASVKMLSNRTVGVETGEAAGGQGIMNFYMADGSSLIYRRGTEYDRARVGWNWRCIPGTTVKQKAGSLPLVPWTFGYESDNALAGGVSDGHTTIGAFNLSRTNPYARTKVFKSYFAFKDALICIGNSIKDADTAAGNIYTTINQTERLTDIYYCLNGEGERSIGLDKNITVKANLSSASWFWQDSTGYIIIPRAGKATGMILTGETREGNWHDIDYRNPDGQVTVNIFQLCIDHGSAAGWKDTSYRYVVVPSVSKNELARFFNEKIIRRGPSSLYIDHNDKKIVSVSYDNYTGIFFMDSACNKAGGLGPDGLAVSADGCVALLLRRRHDGMDLHAADLANNFNPGNRIHLGINRVFRPATFTPAHADGPCTLVPEKGATRISLYLSTNNPVYEGEPVEINAMSK